MISVQELVPILKAIDRAILHDECWQCECLQGFLTQLKMDIPAESQQIIQVLQVGPGEMHACRGCTPCPPADLYADYLRAHGSNLIAL